MKRAYSDGWGPLDDEKPVIDPPESVQVDEPRPLLVLGADGRKVRRRIGFAPAFELVRE